MVTVLLGAVVSIGIAAFALSVILREFQGRWAQVAAALAFDERAFVGELRPAASPRRARPAPARVPHRPSRRAAA
jgi:hypothetical protein